MVTDRKTLGHGIAVDAAPRIAKRLRQARRHRRQRRLRLERLEDRRLLALDFGDAPESYGTLLPSGARHEIVSGFQLGSYIDAEEDGQPNELATGDDWNGDADEDGVRFPTWLYPGQNVNVLVYAPQGGKLDAWVDFDGDGGFAAADERITAAAGTELPVGEWTTLTFGVPVTAVAQEQTYARFRLSTAGGLLPTGLADDGEVEDYAVVIDYPLDFGDAPESYGTTLAAAGARHAIVPGFMLGTSVDGEADGQPTADARGDDWGDALTTKTGSGSSVGCIRVEMPAFRSMRRKAGSWMPGSTSTGKAVSMRWRSGSLRPRVRTCWWATGPP